MTSEISAISGRFGMQLIDDIFATNSIKNDEEEQKQGDIFDALFSAIDKSIEETHENLKETNNTTNSINGPSFGPPFGMQIDGFDYFST